MHKAAFRSASAVHGAIEVLLKPALKLSIGANLLLLGACTQSNESFLQPFGRVADSQRGLFFDVILWMLIVLIPVFVFVPYFAWRYRRTNTRSAFKPEWEFSWPLEILVWGVPVAVVAVLSYLLWSSTHALDPYKPVALAPTTAPLEVQVVGLDWKWLFIYPEQGIASANYLAIPTDRPVHFSLTSDTVMQSFVIPALGSQIYAMAGMTTQLNLIADREGELRGKNTQFNGMGFQNQNFPVRAISATDFDSWEQTVKAQGHALDTGSYAKLSARSTPKQAQSDLGMTDLPGAAIYFSSVEPGLFDKIIAKYHQADQTAQAGQSNNKAGGGN